MAVSDLASRRNSVAMPAGITDAGYNCSARKFFWS